MKGLIFDIQAFSLHDGPGCRTTVFFKGCPLRCRFCANPEGMELKQTELCLQDGNKRMCGYEVSSDEILCILRRDRQYWGDAGGVTFSGGEPLMQSEFLLEVLEECHGKYIHTAMETSSYVLQAKFFEIVRRIDFVFFDVKHMDSMAHKDKTGVSNELILENISTLAGSRWAGRPVVRLPLIPHFNDNSENLAATADFMKKNALEEINILPFHRMGTSKWHQLGMKYDYADVEPQKLIELQAAEKIFVEKGLKCYLGHDTTF